MIRIYLDWGVISNLKKEEFSDLRRFILDHRNELQFPYTPAHFKDLMKSDIPGNDNFNQDLELLGQICEHHLLRWGINGIEVLKAIPSEYFEKEKDKEVIVELGNSDSIFKSLDSDLRLRGLEKLLKSLYQSMPTGIEITNENRDILKMMFPNVSNNSTMWDLMQDITPFSKNLFTDREYYKSFRRTAGDKGFKLDPNSGNWDVADVFSKIDIFLKELNTNLTFREYIDTCFKYKNEPTTIYEYYTTAYLLLDMIGYKSDKLPKPTDNMTNIQTDADHSFYSTYCDYFVVLDKNLATKTKVLFKEFGIPTIVLSPSEFIEIIQDQLHYPGKLEDFITQAFELIKNSDVVEKYLKEDGCEVNTYAFKLPLFYFNFFNYAILFDYTEQNGIIIEFKRVFKNNSTFIYYSESERVLDRINGFFGFTDNEEYQLKKHEFIYGKNEVLFEWKLVNGLIQLTKDSDNNRPILKYVVKMGIAEK